MYIVHTYIYHAVTNCMLFCPQCSPGMLKLWMLVAAGALQLVSSAPAKPSDPSPRIVRLPPVYVCLTPLSGRLTPLSGRLTPLSGRLTPLSGRLTPLSGRLTPLSGRLTPLSGRLTPLSGLSGLTVGRLAPPAGHQQWSVSRLEQLSGQQPAGDAPPQPAGDAPPQPDDRRLMPTQHRGKREVSDLDNVSRKKYSECLSVQCADVLT